MNKAIPKTKEQLVYFLISNISLGTYDAKFLNNVQTNNLLVKRPLTTNQAILLDKIVTRYRKQLAKLELHVDDLISLPWTLEPVQSSPEYTEAYLIAQDNLLILRSPYKKEFVIDFSQSETEGKWIKDKKQWEMPFGLYSLKKAKTILELHYKTVNYCDTITKLLSDVKQYEVCKIWDPTLIYSNNKFLIAGINEPLHEAIKDIDVEYSLKFLTQISTYGIEIDETVIHKYCEDFTYEEVLFATQQKNSAELDDLSLIDKLEKIGTDFILISQSTSQLKVIEYLDIIRNNFSKKIPVVDILGETVDWVNYFDKAKCPVLISSGMYVMGFASTKIMSKIIHLVNSKPIIIK